MSGQGDGAKNREKWHFGVQCILSFIRLRIDSLAKDIKLTAFGVVCGTLQKPRSRGHRSMSQSEKRTAVKYTCWGTVYPLIFSFNGGFACKRSQSNCNQSSLRHSLGNLTKGHRSRSWSKKKTGISAFWGAVYPLISLLTDRFIKLIAIRAACVTLQKV